MLFSAYLARSPNRLKDLRILAGRDYYRGPRVRALLRGLLRDELVQVFVRLPDPRADQLDREVRHLFRLLLRLLSGSVRVVRLAREAPES